MECEMEAKEREEGRRGSPGAKGGSTTRRYSRETKLRAVRLVLEEGFARKDVCREIGVCKSCLNRWVGNYRHAEGYRYDFELCLPSERQNVKALFGNILTSMAA
jgi:transposase-like protein